MITSAGFFRGRAIRLMVAAAAAAAGMAACVLTPPSADAALQSPAVTGVTVKTGGIHGGTHTVLYGRNFTGTTRVLFGTTPATHVQLLAPYKLSVYSPAHAAGAVHIIVMTNHGTSSKVLADEFRYVPPPAVSVPGGLHSHQTANLRGGPFQVVQRVTIAGQPVPYSVVNSTQINATVPQLSTAANAPVQVIDAYGSSPIVYAAVPHPPRIVLTLASYASNDVKLAIAVSADSDSLPTAWDSVQIERTFYPANGAMSSSTVLADLPANATSYDDSTVQPNSSYAYAAVPMLAGVRETPWSPVNVYTLAAPGAPLPLASASAAIRGADSVVLKWAEQGANNPNYSSVMIRRATGTTPPATPGDGTLVANPSSYSGTYVDNTTVGSTTYSYAFFAMSSAGSWASPTAAGVTTPVNGAGWSAPVNEAPNAPFDPVTCEPASGLCHAIGGANSKSGLWMRDTSGTWSWEAPYPQTRYGVDELTCSGANFCVARTQFDETVVYQNGSWSAPVTIGSGADNIAMSCASPTLCLLYVGGYPWRWNGATWTQLAGPATGAGWVSCVAPSWCMAAVTNLSTGASQSYTYDGTSWTATNNGAYAGPLSCTSPTFCMIAGANEPAYETWNGSTWTRTTSSGLTPTLNGAWWLDCGSANACVLNSLYGQHGTLAFDGTTWMTYDFETTSENVTDVGCYASNRCLAMTPTSEYDFTGGP